MIKTLILSSLVLTCLFGISPVYAIENNQSEQHILSICKTTTPEFLKKEEKSCQKDKPETKEETAQSGCCSWHGGVCGCSGGRKVCCDGSLSPSCGC